MRYVLEATAADGGRAFARLVQHAGRRVRAAVSALGWTDLLWAAMLAMHVAVLVTAGRSGSLALDSGLGLVLANIFFFLKLARVRFLRGEPSRHRRLVWLLALLLLHDGLLPTAGTNLPKIPAPLLVFALGVCSWQGRPQAAPALADRRKSPTRRTERQQLVISLLRAFEHLIDAEWRENFRCSTLGWHDPTFRSLRAS